METPPEDCTEEFAWYAKQFGYQLGEQPRLRFAESEDASGLVLYTLGSFGGVGVVETHCSQELLDCMTRPWPQNAESLVRDFRGRDYEIALVGLAWALTTDTVRYVMPHWNWKQAAEAVGVHEVHHVRWEFWSNSFIEARSWERTDPPDEPPWTRKLDYTGMFRVGSFPSCRTFSES